MRIVFGMLTLLSSVSNLSADIIDFSSVTDPVGQYLATHPIVPGAGLMIADFKGKVIHEQYWGGYNRQTVIPIASATKWLSAGVIMSLVDDGRLNLDRRVGTILPSFAGQPNGKSDMTVRQMMSHTSGLPGATQWESSSTVSLQTAAANIGQLTSMQSIPGTSFAYGGASMQVAGAVAEVVGETGWASLFDNRIAVPLGMTNTDYLGVGTASNPRIAGGAQTSIDNLSRYLQMLGNHGEYNGLQVLSAAAVEEMLTDQTGAATLASKPNAIGAFQGYGIGNWIERRDANGKPMEFTSPGVFGTTPWLNINQGYYGIFLVDSNLGSFDGFTDDIRNFTANALASSVPEPSSALTCSIMVLACAFKRTRSKLVSVQMYRSGR